MTRRKKKKEPSKRKRESRHHHTAERKDPRDARIDKSLDELVVSCVHFAAISWLLPLLATPLRNKLQATYHYINRSIWYLFCCMRCKMRSSNHDIAHFTLKKVLSSIYMYGINGIFQLTVAGKSFRIGVL